MAANPAPIPFPNQTAAGHPSPAETLTLKPWQRKVIDLLSRGASVAAAMRAVAMSGDAFYKARERQPQFKELAEAARDFYKASVADEFHASAAYARQYVDSVLHDETAPPALRLRAALAILNRKTGRWLPSPIPDAGEAFELLKPLDTLDTDKQTETAETDDTPAPAPAPALGPGVEYEARTGETLDTLYTPEEEELLKELTVCLGTSELAETFFRLVQDAERNRHQNESGGNH